MSLTHICLYFILTHPPTAQNIFFLFFCFFVFFFTCQRNNGTSILYAAPVVLYPWSRRWRIYYIRKTRSSGNKKRDQTLPQTNGGISFYIRVCVCMVICRLDEKEQQQQEKARYPFFFFSWLTILLPYGISIVEDSNFLRSEKTKSKLVLASNTQRRRETLTLIPELVELMRF